MRGSVQRAIERRAVIHDRFYPHGDSLLKLPINRWSLATAFL
jgi:hypothetical protein